MRESRKRYGMPGSIIATKAIPGSIKRVKMVTKIMWGIAIVYIRRNLALQARYSLRIVLTSTQ